MQASTPYPEPVPPTDPTPSRLRTVTGNKFPRKCACGCGLPMPGDPEVRYVVDFGAAKPYPAPCASAPPPTRRVSEGYRSEWPNSPAPGTLRDGIDETTPARSPSRDLSAYQSG